MCSFYQHRKKTNDRFCPSIILRLKKNVVFLKCFILCYHFDWSYRHCSSSSSCKVFFFLLLPNNTHLCSFVPLTKMNLSTAHLGTYRILNGPQSARSFPPAAQQGPFETEITFSEQFASVWEDVRCFFFFRRDRCWIHKRCQWELVSNGSDEFFIQSARTGARAYATPIMVGLSLIQCRVFALTSLSFFFFAG